MVRTHITKKGKYGIKSPADNLLLQVLKFFIRIESHYGVGKSYDGITRLSGNKAKKYWELAYGTARQPGLEARIIWD